MSLLMYEWQTERYDFTALESGYMVLLRVKPTKRPLVLKPLVKEGEIIQEGEDPRRIERILKQLLSKRVVGDPLVANNFGLTSSSSLKPGEIYTNGRPTLSLPTYGDWARCVVAFLTDEDFCLLMTKEWPGTPQDTRSEELWLPVGLYEKDGKSLVIERLWGKPYPRRPKQSNVPKN
jgi:hypothetical protein